MSQSNTKLHDSFEMASTSVALVSDIWSSSVHLQVQGHRRGDRVGERHQIRSGSCRLHQGLGYCDHCVKCLGSWHRLVKYSSVICRRFINVLVRLINLSNYSKLLVCLQTYLLPRLCTFSLLFHDFLFIYIVDFTCNVLSKNIEFIIQS